MEQALKWPQGHTSAAMVTVELDAEFIWLGMDPTNISRPKTLSMGEYGMLRGLDRLLDCLKEYEVMATFFVLGTAVERYGNAILKVAAAGHEIALHGYEHLNYGLLSPMQQQEQIGLALQAVTRLTGKKPSGFRLPEGNMTPETLGILREAGFTYDCSMLDSDLPYIITEGIANGLIEIPMRWDMQDFPFFCFNFHPRVPPGVCRIANYSQVLNLWRSELQAYHDYGLCYVIKFDPQTIGTPGRISMVDALLADMRRSNMWVATGNQIASHTRTLG